ncbi:MAG TPA: dephospho-CoA kinase [Candidatus Limosilactobacillus merdigallinarum]|uniref:Dephospho-CoA kinase n=1 Tax=Candidatus Limosilactobacillus merdigallinarum TaxID=2838652 RepID=A0A9D1VGY1_9LACO|nr:dephospho-CoA kinase [Candidatus Limosilactobacillus merdigallinarum]
MAKVIGVTGGIASGKSLVSAYLIAHGFSIVDADIVAREVVAPDSIGLKKVAATFGNEIVDTKGNLDRKRLAKIVFADDSQLKLLNDILQPLIRQQIQQELQQFIAQGQEYIFLVAPLLFEENYQSMCDEIMVVTVTLQTQLQRLMSRDQLNEQQARRRIAAQWPLSRKIALADVVIDNDGTIAQTKAQLAAWIKRTIA